MAVHHVKNADLRVEIIKCKKTDILSDLAIEMFRKMADKYSRRYRYKDEADRQDCISIAVIDCYLYWRGYDPEISQNAFAYYTTVIHNGFSKAARKIWPIPTSKKVSLSNRNIYSF